MDTGIHTLTFDMVPVVTVIALDTVLVIFYSRTAAATGVFWGSWAGIELNII